MSVEDRIAALEDRAAKLDARVAEVEAIVDDMTNAMTMVNVYAARHVRAKIERPPEFGFRDSDQQQRSRLPLSLPRRAEARCLLRLRSPLRQ